jgi:predicted Zn finger-like uncharacterized protein
MKIVCDACSAKYSIADDKVKGKVFKIRCKKCSNIIVVRGNAGGAEEPAAPVYDQKETRVYDYQGYDEGGAAPAAEDAVWHLVIDQEQVGPLTAAEVQSKFSSGEIDADTYIWREGFADWQPLSAVDAFAGVVAGGGGGAIAAPRAEAGGGLFAGGAEDGTARSDPGDLFAAAGAGADEGADDAGSDLFGGAARGGKAAAAASSDAAMFGGGGAAAQPDKGSDKAARAAADKRLRGERNENSVLFSLNNLAALASDQPRGAAPAAAAPASASQSSSGMAQQGGGEGSGLIDIRSMASTYLSDKGAAKARPAVGSIDDLPVFSTSAFSEPAVIMPSPQQSGANNKLLFALIGVVGLLAVVAVVLVVVVFTGGDKNQGGQGTQVAAGDPPAAAGATPPGETPPPPVAGEPAKVEPTPSAAVPAEEPKPAPAEEPKPEPTKVATRDEPKSSRDRDKKPEKKPEEKKPEPKETRPASSGSSGCLDEVGCLLADKPPACCSKYGKKSGGGGSKSDSGGGGGGSDLPETLDRTMISSGVSKVRGRVDACASRSSAKGEVKVQVKVASNGSVSSVSVKNTPDPSLGSCVASAMEKASFSKTQNGGTFSYPFIFR